MFPIPKEKHYYRKNPVTKESMEALLKTETSEWMKRGLSDFIKCMEEGDNTYLEEEKNSGGGYQRYVGRKPSELTYCFVVSSFMS